MKTTEAQRKRMADYRERNREKINQQKREFYYANKERLLEIDREYRENNKDAIKERRRNYYLKNRKNIIDKSNKYYSSNREKVLQRTKKYAEDNREIVLERKRLHGREGYNVRWYHKNKEKKLAYKKEYLKTPSGRFHSKLQGAKRRSFARDLIHKFTQEEWESKVNATNGICQGCNKNVGIKNLALDHIIPISWGTKKEYAIDDVQPLCKSCNSAKKNYHSEKDTTYTNMWLFKKVGPINLSTENKLLLDDSIGKKEGLSRFNPVFAENVLNFWSGPQDIVLDPFAGRTRALVVGLKNRKYIGFEISKTVAEHMTQTIDQNISKFEHKPEIYNKDSFKATDIVKEPVDFIFTCPPYWNLERYESCQGQLSDIKDYYEFLNQLEQILVKSFSLLKPGKFMALVVGDWRMKGVYFTFHKDVLDMMERNKVPLHDLIAVQTVSENVAALRFGSHKNSKITSKVFEYLLIFKKLAV